MQINIFIAFIAGIASFLAPCVIPLVPAYVSYITGVSVAELESSTFTKYRSQIILNSLFYIVGFSLIFILLGLGAAAISQILVLNRILLIRIGGILIIVFGLYSMGLFNRFALTQREFRFQLPDNTRRIKYLGPFLLGCTFALAWTPCVGAVFASILTLAASSGTIGQGAFLLFVYSLGISLPFFLIAITIGQSYHLLRQLGPRLHTINFVAGIFLVALGVVMVSGKYDVFNGSILGRLNGIFPILGL